MGFTSILDGNIKINTMDDNSGRRYFSIRLEFSENDTLMIYRNSVDELIDELPAIITSAIQARIVAGEYV